MNALSASLRDVSLRIRSGLMLPESQMQTHTQHPAHLGTIPPRPAHEPAALTEIQDPARNLTLWQRTLEPELVAELARLPRLPAQAARHRLAPGAGWDARRRAVVTLLADHGLDALELPVWTADLLDLLNRFLRLAPDWPTELRLEVVSDDACHRFHVDRTRLRLVCTYRGPGTEWLDDGQVDREALMGHLPNESILRHGHPGRMETGWVGLMKGAIYPDDRALGLVHRSPPIAGTGETRILFCLDA
jgi:hypothetical protein